jgi:tRNA pseudouridine55 synthase
MDGVLVIDKPAGFTSHDVVAKARRILGQRQIGHTGTLDPAATGVLPLVVGKATKLARYLSAADKSYEATVVLGVGTSTLDAEGEITSTAEVSCSEAQVLDVLNACVGEIEQVPPMYSAKKVGGKKLYELARKGEEVVREPKKIRIYGITQVQVRLPEITFHVSCSSGTYIRVLALDIGAALGVPAHLKTLRRTHAGVFDLSQSVSLQALADSPQLAETSMLGMSEALVGLPKILLPQHLADKVVRGYQLAAADVLTLDVPVFAEDTPLALVGSDGLVCAIVRAQVASSSLADVRRDLCVLKTERVL